MQTLDATKTKKHKPSIHSEYLHCAFNLTSPQVKKTIKSMVKMLKTYDFDAFAFRGMSGALFAPILAMLCGKTLIMVRKPKHVDVNGNPSTHSAELVEGDLNATKYIIVDDFICSGRTLGTVVEEIAKFNPQAICIGAVLYNDPLKFGSKYNSLQGVSMHAREDLKKFAADDPEVYRIKVAEK